MSTIENSISDSSARLTDLLKGNDALFPTYLNAAYPRIVKKICDLWQEPIAACRYFNDLLTTQREKRQGFPFAVHREIFLLSRYYTTHHPEGMQYDEFWNAIYCR